MSDFNSFELEKAIRERIKQIEDLKKEIQSYSSLSSEQLLNVKKRFFSQIIYYNNFDNDPGLSRHEIEQLIFFDKVTGKFPFTNYIKSYNRMRILFYIEKLSNDPDKDISVQLIQHIYLLLFWEEKEIDETFFTFPFRDSLAISDEENLSAASPLPVSEIPYQLDNLIQVYLEKKDEYHPLIFAAQFQSLLLKIAPFRKGNEELSFYIFFYLVMKEGYPPFLFSQASLKKYRESLIRDDGQINSIYKIVLEEGKTSLEYLLDLMQQAKDKVQFITDRYFSSLVKEIKSTERDVKRFKIQKNIDEAAVQDLISAIEHKIKHYFMDNYYDELNVAQQLGRFKDIKHAHLINESFKRYSIKPLWDSSPGPERGSVIFHDTVDSVMEIEITSHHLYVPTSLLYFGVLPTHDGNYLFSVQVSSYLDFKREERFSKNLSFFRAYKGGIDLEDWDDKEINRFFEISMQEFFDHLTEKVTERKRILKK